MPLVTPSRCLILETRLRVAVPQKPVRKMTNQVTLYFPHQRISKLHRDSLAFSNWIYEHLPLFRGYDKKQLRIPYLIWKIVQQIIQRKNSFIFPGGCAAGYLLATNLLCHVVISNNFKWTSRLFFKSRGG